MSCLMSRVCLRMSCRRWVDVRVVADVPLQDPRRASLRTSSTGVGDLAQDRFGALGGGGHLLGDEQFERVQGDRHFAAEQFQKLQVVFVERPRAGALDVERAQDLIVQDQGNRERAAGVGRADQMYSGSFAVSSQR